ncbi:MAG: hypothetical protein JO257_01080, partial [Deltaproteobacteria bacterium]|nr:hypothetical protein [Deltaproteobacteria bacterium]
GGGGANGGGGAGGNAGGGGANAGGGANGGGANAGGGANGGGATPEAGGGTPYGGGADGPGGPYGAPQGVFSIQLVVTGRNDVADNAHAQYKPGSQVKVGVIARDAHGNVVSGCEPVFEIGENSGADGLAHGALNGNEVTFLREGKFSIFAHCKDHPEISTRGEHNNFNFETSDSQFAHCTNTPACNSCVDKCDIKALEQKAGGDKKAHHGPNAGEVLLIIGLGGAAAYLLYGLAGGGVYCFDITSSNNGSCPPNHYCDASQSACEMNLAQTMAICTCHVAQCTVNFTGCSAGREDFHDIHDVNSLVERGFALQRSSSIARVAPTNAPHTAAAHSGSHLAAVGAVLGAAAIATTAYVIWHRSQAKRSSVEVVPWVSPSGAGVTALGRF